MRFTKPLIRDYLREHAVDLMAGRLEGPQLHLFVVMVVRCDVIIWDTAMCQTPHKIG